MNPRRTRVLKRLSIIFLCLFLVWAVFLWLSWVRLQRAYAALEKADRPMKIEQIIPKPIPDSENAAVLYQEAFKLLESEKVGEEDVIRYTGKLLFDYTVATVPKEKLDELRPVLQLHAVAQAVSLVAGGEKRPGCGFHLDYRLGAEMTVQPVIVMMRGISRLLALKARLETVDGESEQAWTTIVAALKLADSLRDEPTLVCQLVRIAQFGLTVQAIQRLGDCSLPADEQAVAVDRLLTGFDNLRPLVNGMDGDRLIVGEACFSGPPRAYAFSVLRDLRCRLGKPTGERFLSVPLAGPLMPLRNADHATYLDVMRQGAEMAGTPYYRCDLVRESAIESRIRRWLPIAHSLAPGVLAVKARHTTMQAQVAVTRVGLALKRHKRAHGTYPTDLTTIDPAIMKDVPVDPFSGKPLIYRAEKGEGFVLYSVGENRKDDGGKPESGVGRRDGDIVWQIPK